MLELKNVSKSYGRTQALKNVNLSVSRGEIVGLFGENGAGASEEAPGSFVLFS